MKAILTGATGFLARELYNSLELAIPELQIVPYFGRKVWDLASKEQTKEILQSSTPDYIIHCAVQGGKRLKEDTYQDYLSNLKMYENLMSNQNNFGKLINICSGAAFDRRYSISTATENEIFTSFPKDPYGRSKNEIARKCRSQNNVITFRLFGCFGFFEEQQRFIKSAITNYFEHKPIYVFDDKLMDFIYVRDFSKVVQSFFESPENFKHNDYNVVYRSKHTLSQIANMINNLDAHKVDIVVQNSTRKNYTGSDMRFRELDIELTGLEESLKEVYMMMCFAEGKQNG